MYISIYSRNGNGKMSTSLIIKKALEMRKMSYSPYSHFAVGAALLCGDGNVYGGCNIENGAFSPSICAERTAFAKAVSEGERDFVAIAIAGGEADKEPADFCTPCGVCRQVMSEFCGPDFKVILVKSEVETREYRLEELLPLSFKLD